MLTEQQKVAAAAAIIALAVHERHVKTPEGEAFYHLPIGSLIIAHPHIHVLKEKHLKLVYSFGKAYGVPKEAKVWVAKLVDMHNDAEMAEAEKYVTIGKPGGFGIHQASGRMFTLGISGPAESGGLTQVGLHALETTHKLVPESELKVPLTKNGKNLGWVPEDYKPYVWPEQPSDIIYAKAPDGGWWAFSGGPSTQLGEASEQILNSKLTSGALAEYQPPMGADDALGPPPHPETPPGPSEAKVTMGGIPVTVDELTKAIEILHNAKSTNVKLPLKAAGHKLQHMDYMGVSKNELKKHPELKVPKGTKQKHVGQVKVAVLHHMTEALKTLGASDAQHAQADTVGKKAEADASQAQVLTPATVDVGGTEVAKDAIKAMVDKLKSTSTPVSTVLGKAGGWPGGSVMVPIAKAHVKESGHAPEDIKTAIIHVLEEKAGIAVTADVNSGHEAASAPKDDPFAVAHHGVYGEPAETGKTIPVMIGGEKAGEVPAGSLIYQHASAGVSSRWVKLPSGKWQIFSKSDHGYHMSEFPSHEKQADILQGSVQSGALKLEDLEEEQSKTEKVSKKLAHVIQEATPALLIWSTETGSTTDFGEALTAGLVKAGGTGGQWLGKFPSDYSANLAGKYGLFSSSPGGERWHITSGLDKPFKVTHYSPDASVGEVVPVQQVLGAVQAYIGQQHSQAPDEVLKEGSVEYLKEALKIATPGTQGYKNIEIKLHAAEHPTLSAKGKLKALIKDGAISPGKARKGNAANDIDYFLAQAAVQVSHPATQYGSGWEKYVWKDDAGHWTVSYNNSGNKPESYHLVKKNDGGIDVTHTTFNGGNEVPVDISDAAYKYIHPNAAFIPENNYQQQGLLGKMYKYGHYYKPKGKAHLEIGPGDGDTGTLIGKMSKFTYWDVHGNSKEVNSTYAAKALVNMTDFHEQPKDVEPSKPKAAPAKMWATPLVPNAVPGTNNHALEKPSYTIAGTPNKLVVHDDMSAAGIHDDASDTAHFGNIMALTQDEVHTLAMAGKILDEYGTTVMVPGANPPEFHVFGSEPIHLYQLNNMLDSWQNASGHQDELGVLSHELQDENHVELDKVKGYLAEQKATNWSTQADAITGLLSNLANGPVEIAASNASQTEGAKFLKNMPAGITSSKDIFEFDAAGHAESLTVQAHYPSSGMGSNFSTMPFSYMSAEVLKSKIQHVSENYGGGKVVGTHPASMNKDKKAEWLNAWVHGDMTGVFHLDAGSGKVSPAHPGAPDNPDTHIIGWAPFGKGEIPAAQTVEGDWSQPGVSAPLPEIHNYLIKAGLNHAENLSAQEQRQWVKAHRDHNQLTVDMISKEAQDRFDMHSAPLSDTPVWTADIKPAKSYDAYLESNSAAGNWTTQAINDFVDDYSAELTPFAQQVFDTQGFGGTAAAADTSGWGYSVRRDIIQKFLNIKEAQEEAERLKPVWEKTPGGMSPVSSHPIYEIQDQFDNHFFFKPADMPFLAEQEDQAGKIANAWGFKAPASRLIEFDGKSGQAQAKLNAEGDMQYGAKLGFYDAAPVPWTELTQRQLSDVAREHVLDWALDNDDARASNFLQMPDGSVVGIDKGRSWADFGHWNGLAGDERMDERSAQLVTQLYQAVRDHKFSKDTADQTFIDVMHRAQKMQHMTDERLRDMLDTAFAHRTQYAGQYSTKAELVQAAIDRKNGLAKDFNKLWAGVYKDAGWKLPEVPEPKLPETRKGDQLYSGFSDPELLDHVNTVTVAGVPAFFGGPDLDKGNVLLWREFQGVGTDNPTLHGQTGTHGAAYDRLMTWCKVNQTSGPVAAPAAPVDTANVKGEADWYNGIIEAVKTISYHNQNGNQEYNQSRLDKMNIARTQMEERLEEAEAMIAAGPDTDAYAEFTTLYGSPELNQHAAKYYLDMAAQVDKAREDSTVFQPGTLPKWEPPDLKKPEEKLKEPAKIKVELKNATRSHGIDQAGPGGITTPLDDDGNYHAGPGGLNYPGHSWHITLPTGEVIVFSGGADQGIELAHHGRIRFTAVHKDGLASLERIRSQLQSMGLDMQDADENDLHLFYWRHLANVLSDRNDSTDGKYGKVWQVLLDHAKDKGAIGSGTTVHYLDKGERDEIVRGIENEGMDPADELALWQKAWSNVTSPEQVQHFVNVKGYLPHLEHFDLKHPDKASGAPHWMRFDLKPSDVLAEDMPQHTYTGNTENGALLTLRAGGTHGKEEQLRQVGAALGQMGNPYDSGATNYVYTRLNQENYSGWSMMFNPSVMARTGTYAFTDDEFGKTESRVSKSPFDFKSWKGNSDSSNETLIENAMSILDSVEVIRAHAGAAQRAEIIKQLHEIGIDEIRGVPVEQRVVVGNVQYDDMAVIKAAMRANQDDIDW